MNIGITGTKGEDMVCRFLMKEGYQVLKRNYQCRFGEIDIIAENKEYLIFVEVKTRKNKAFGAPEDAVGYYKKKNIFFATKIFLKHHGIENKRIRFDVISIILKPFSIKHIENAFIESDV